MESKKKNDTTEIIHKTEVDSHNRANKPMVRWCCSVTRSCLTLCDPTDCSTPGSSVLHCILEFAQIPVHRVSHAIQPSHPLSLPFPFAFNLSQQQQGSRVFSDKSTLDIRCPKYCSFSFGVSPSSEYSGLISFRIDWCFL